ncbi:MAG: hypothetical protein IJY50_00995 [Clostridia bacterium]|nr:hypothetical protein [Clostridia bacterium]
MFKNIGKRIQFLAILLALLTFIGCLALAVWFLLAALKTSDETLYAAGIQGTVIFGVLALILPLFSWLIYGFGTLIISAEKQAESEREAKEILRHALAEGALSEDIARKLTPVLAKLASTTTAIPRAAAPARPAAPVARPVTPPVQKETPVVEQAPQPAATEVKVEEVVTKEPEQKPVESAPVSAPVEKAPDQTVAPKSEPPKPVSPAFTPLKPMGGKGKTY